jgi:DNA-binding response OmpR family regulator
MPSLPPEGVGPRARARARVLVVNGSEDVIDAMRVFLEDSGFETFGVRETDILRERTDVAAVLREFRPEVVVYDVSLPYELTWSLYERLRQLPEAQGCCWVLTTTNARAAEPVTKSAALIELLLKPFDLKQLLNAVHDAVATCGRKPQHAPGGGT